MNPKLKHYLLISPRIILGLIFVLSGVGKIIDSESAKYMVELMASEIYWLIEWKSEIVYATIIIELILAVFLLAGKKLSSVYIFSFIFIGIFTGVSAYFLFKGFSVSSCGCFGAFGLSGGLEATLIRNIILLILIIIGFWIQLSQNRIQEFTPSIKESTR